MWMPSNTRHKAPASSSPENHDFLHSSIAQLSCLSSYRRSAGEVEEISRLSAISNCLRTSKLVRKTSTDRATVSIAGVGTVVADWTGRNFDFIAPGGQAQFHGLDPADIDHVH